MCSIEQRQSLVARGGYQSRPVNNMRYVLFCLFLFCFSFLVVFFYFCYCCFCVQHRTTHLPVLDSAGHGRFVFDHPAKRVNHRADGGRGKPVPRRAGQGAPRGCPRADGAGHCVALFLFKQMESKTRSCTPGVIPRGSR